MIHLQMGWDPAREDRTKESSGLLRGGRFIVFKRVSFTEPRGMGKRSGGSTLLCALRVPRLCANALVRKRPRQIQQQLRPVNFVRGGRKCLCDSSVGAALSAIHCLIARAARHRRCAPIGVRPAESGLQWIVPSTIPASGGDANVSNIANWVGRERRRRPSRSPASTQLGRACQQRQLTLPRFANKLA